MSPEDEAKMEAMIQPDGSLCRLDGNYVDWHPDHDSVSLDGLFTPNQLRWIANYVERGAKQALKRRDRTMDVWVLTSKENGWFYRKDGQFSMSPDHAYVMTEEEAAKLEAENTNLVKRKVRLVLSN